MHQTTLPRGKQRAIDPSTGVTAIDVELAGAVAMESAEAIGAAITPSGKAIAVAATSLIIVLDMSVPRSISTDWFDARPVQPGNLG
ncbi:hypothetical protein ACFYTS_13265 [Nocardia sp. NPDC004151]|uniref:hypothetical protein n=1 Tax=Nocardia sp. NPDC004151 TaxID=3364304 RepID=UPI0036A62E7F